MYNPNCWRQPRPEIKLEEDAIWPELTTDIRKFGRKCNIEKKVTVYKPENIEAKMLDQNEYPELGAKAIRIKQEKYESTMDNLNLPVEENSRRKSYRMYLRKNKSKDPIKISIEQILKQHRSNSDSITKETRSTTNYIIKVKNPLDKDQVMPARRGKICISRVKRPSKIKQAILWERELKRQINMQRNNIKCEKNDSVDAILDAINLSKLKVIADPIIDVNITRSMSTMNMFGQNYRQETEIIGDDTIEIQDGITEQTQKLLLSPKCVINKSIQRNNMVPGIEVNNENIIDKTLNLCIKDENEEPTITPNLSQSLESIKYSKKFREYCTNLINPSLCKSLEIFLSEITQLQRKLYDKDNTKGRCKRRFYTGIKEVEKYITVKKIKFVIIATDIEKIVDEGVLDKSIKKLMCMCHDQDIPVCFGLLRRKLGYLMHGKGFVSCIGITNYSGREDKLETLLLELIEAKIAFRKISSESDLNFVIFNKQLNLSNMLLSERVNMLLKIAASMT